MIKSVFQVLLSALLIGASIPSAALAQAAVEFRIGAVGHPAALPAGTLLRVGLPNPLPFASSPIFGAAASLESSLAPVVEGVSAQDAALGSEVPTAAAASLQARQILLSDGAAGSSEPSRWQNFWSSSRKIASLPEVPAPDSSGPRISLTRPPAPAKSLRRTPFFGLASASPVIAGHAAGWAAGIWLEFKPFVLVGAVAAVTFIGSKVVDLIVRAISRRVKAGPTATDKARFLAGLGSWIAGISAGLAVGGISPGALVGTLGAGATLAVNDTIGNFTQAVLFLFYRPFSIGETIRIGDMIYSVEDISLERVKLKELGKLSKDAAAAPKQGYVLTPYSQFDPTPQRTDALNAYKYAWLKDESSRPLYFSYKYSQLAKKSIGLFRSYVPSSRGVKFSIPKLSFKGFLKEGAGALQRSPWKAAGTIFLLGMGPALTILNSYLAWHWLSAIYPYLHAGVLGLATYSAAGWSARLGAFLAKRFGWPKEVAVIAGQGAVYLLGSTLALRAVGLQWTSLLTGFVPVAGALIYALRDILGNLWQAIKFRFNRQAGNGDDVQFLDDEGGKLVEINKMYAILQTSQQTHVLVPYSVVEASPLGSFESADKQSPGLGREQKTRIK